MMAAMRMVAVTPPLGTMVARTMTEHSAKYDAQAMSHVRSLLRRATPRTCNTKNS